MIMNDTIKLKKDIRAELRSKLNAMTSDEREAKSQDISNRLIELLRVIKPKTCLMYKALPTEVNVDLAIKYCLDNGIAVYLPRVNGDDMEIVEYGEMVIGAYGILEPVGEPTVIVPSVAVVPLLGVDKLKNRLGKGKGYYDRYFENKKIYKIAVAFDTQLVEKLPVDDNDIAMDELIIG